MKKYLVLLTVSLGLFVNSASADALKNSLTNMLNEKDTSSSMVNLSGLDLNAKPKPVKKVIKTRSDEAVFATVNDHKILKKDADAHLKKRTQGKMSNVDLLPKNQRLRIIQEMSLPILAADSAQKELSEAEKEAVYKRVWMQQEALKIKISDEELKEVYNKLKQQAEDNNNTANIPTFESIKDKMKLQMIEKKMIANLMKDVEIKVEKN
jgi:hypothetical protein